MSVYIIAEAGVNHNGNLELAKKMVYKAKEAGADCIKFQTFVSKNVVSKNANKADYQKQQTKADESQLAMLQKLELTFNDFVKLNNYCKDQGIQFLSTPFDFDSIDFLASLDMGIWKIPSGEITNLPYLVKIAKMHKPIIMSTGMSTISEIEDAMSILRENGSGEITLLHCTTEYPTPYTDVNLKAMDTLKEKFNVPIGYSDHTKGIEIPVAAAAIGATVIEKHFTLDRNMEGPDHKASLEPCELKAMVNAIRNTELAIGIAEKKVTESEKKNIAIARKSIVASRDIKRGEVFTPDNLTVKRPGNGISPMRWFEVLGKTAKCDFEEDELIVV
ncbi:N-acetylneuraminate synthase [Sporomusa malonica]|uniref:N-acetylneuraminate synthase n=1 Tax=Sporomusa malonica TaxID=112901 RepID=A0A1W1YUC1_9FIRM|nr:N-acetylneuraminate synthase [Sporomusa malonica]SMC39421.1 N-acetylneuraminate synthase [Sporomusa malonica]